MNLEKTNVTIHEQFMSHHILYSQEVYLRNENLTNESLQWIHYPINKVESQVSIYAEEEKSKSSITM